MAELKIDNALYDRLGEDWYEARDNPVALLRAESRWRNPWVVERLRRLQHQRGDPPRVLDVATGGGFLANTLAREGFSVVGVDVSEQSLLIARSRDSTRTVEYLRADALSLPFPDASFDAVCMMDFLEHVENPEAAIAEATRVLQPGGLLFFHTFNRNWLSWLVVIRGVEWFVRNTPPRMHVLRLFIKPRELIAMLGRQGLDLEELFGSRPRVASRAFWTLLREGIVQDDFEFRRSSSLAMGYTGVATRRCDMPGACVRPATPAASRR
jgi:2-polyprenyl-6-hydroxyphenyl methylase/3-demethylubiquinone-9 3-methyltransferase